MVRYPHVNHQLLRGIMRPQTVWPGQVYGRLTVVRDTGNRKRGNRVMECMCLCGATTYVMAVNLRTGNTKSCGCMNRETAAARSYKHGAAHSKPYRVYIAARQRCENPRHKNYDRYGGRGIEFRLPSFDKYWEFMGATWFEGATIERIDNDGHYELGNIRWATRKEQSQNTSQTRVVTYKGESASVSEWARRVGISRKSMEERLAKWPLARALTEPSNRKV